MISRYKYTLSLTYTYLMILAKAYNHRDHVSYTYLNPFFSVDIINYPAASGRGMKTIFSPLSAADFNNAASRGEFDPPNTIAEILSLLDRQSGDPSVIDKYSELKEEGIELTSYDTLSKIALYRHTLNVAEQMMKRTGPGAICGESIIAALGHDLGKIVGYRINGYKTSMHPHLSVGLLNKIKFFKEYPKEKKGNVLYAIENHHSNIFYEYEKKKITPNESDKYLAMKLRKCDAGARSEELINPDAIK